MLLPTVEINLYHSKTSVKQPLSKRLKIGFQDNSYRLMQVKCTAECSKVSSLQYFRPSLSYHLCFVYFEWLFYTGFTVSGNNSGGIRVNRFSRSQSRLEKWTES